MKRHQTGEVMLVVMVVMMSIVLLSRGHMGMMGHDRGHTAHPAETAPQFAPGASAEPQR